ncbi:MAG TPA: hypothetical protein VFA68_11500 [Terriglobales bacterium]|nr:hypothetical protein [Terriglobales bacterium]
MQCSNQDGGQSRWRPFLLALMFLSLSSAVFAQTSIFSIQNSPSPNVFGNTLNAVVALSASDAWAVGFQNSSNLNESRTLTLHWDGVSWRTIPSPNPGKCNQGNFGNVLTSVAAVSSNDVWAVGFTFPCNALLQPMTMHWDGTKWSVVATPKLPFNNNALNGVFALASDNVYAVGFQTASNGASLTLVEHWDGTSWTVMSSPNKNQTGNVLQSISGTSPSDIWAVGDAVAPNVPVRTLVEHFDGTQWKLVNSPNPLPTGSLNQNVLVSVTAVSPTDATAVGFILDSSFLRELTMVQHWDGVSWKVVSSPNVDSNSGSFNTLKSVSAFSSSNIYAIGFFANGNTVAQQRTLVEHFDGTSWSIVSSPTKGLAQQLNGVFALPGTTNVWSVGAWAQNGTDPETGLLIVPKSLVLFSPIG